MLGFLTYTLEAGIIFAVLTFIYKSVYCGASYNRWERGYILISTVASYLLPLMKVPFHTAPRPSRPYEYIVEIVSRDPVDVVTLSHDKTVQSSLSEFLHSQLFDNIIAVIFAIYIAGVAVKLVSYIGGIRKTLRLRRGDFTTSGDGIRIYRTGINTVAFSFFRNIFLGVRSHELSQSEMQAVLSHERNHIRGRHSIDTLLLGFYSVIQWMNPMVRVAQRHSRILCENIADERVLPDGSLTEYSRLILRLGIQKSADGGANAKSSGALLQRIARLLNTDSERIRRIRFICTIPLLMLTIAAYLILAGMANPRSTGLEVPVDGKYRISAGYFENQKIMGPDGVLYNASHRQIDMAAVPGAVVFSPACGRVQELSDSTATILYGDMAITIGGVSVSGISVGDTLRQHQPIGTAYGDCPMFIRVSYGGKPMNPELLFDFGD